MSKSPHNGTKFYRNPKIGGGLEVPYNVYNNGYYNVPCINNTPERYTAYWQRRLLDAMAYALPLKLPENWERGTF